LGIAENVGCWSRRSGERVAAACRVARRLSHVAASVSHRAASVLRRAMSVPRRGGEHVAVASTST